MPCQKYTVGAGWPAVGRWATTWGNLGATRRWWGATRWATSRASRGPRGRLKPTRLTSPRKSPGQTGRQVRHPLLPHCCQPLHVSLASLEPFPNPVQWLCTRPQIAVRPLCHLRVFPPSTITDLAPQVQTGNPGMSDRTVQGKHVHQ